MEPMCYILIHATLSLTLTLILCSTYPYIHYYSLFFVGVSEVCQSVLAKNRE